MAKHVLDPLSLFKPVFKGAIALCGATLLALTGIPLVASAASPTIRQDLPLDCESAALAIAMDTTTIGSQGSFNVSQGTIFNDLPKQPYFWVGDPYKGFVGNVYGSEGTGPGSGYGVYANPIAAVAEELGANAMGPNGSTTSFTGWSTSQMAEQIEEGHPLVIWIDYRSLASRHGYGVSYHRVADGRVIAYTMHEHAVTVVSYNPGNGVFTLIDVYSGHHFNYSSGQLRSMLGTFGGMAVAISRGPSIQAVSPSVGPIFGGQIVNVSGTYFSPSMRVSLGGHPIAFTYDSSSRFSFTSAATSAGSEYLQVSTGTGTSQVTGATRYTFTPPSVSSISPAAGPTSGNQEVKVTGFWFTPGITARLGGTSVTPLDVTGSSFSFVTPAEAAGYAQLQVTSNGDNTALTADAGYIYTPLASYFPLTPYRIMDTRRSGGPLGPGQTRELTIASGASLVPAAATAVVINVTAVSSSTGGLLTVYPTGTSLPLASSLNFGARTVTANLVTVTLGQNSASDSNREINIYNPVGSVNVVVDVEGYFGPQSGADPAGEFHPVVPTRLLDTRVSGGPLGPNEVRKVVISGVPSDGTAGAVVLNLTGIAGASNTYLSVFPTNNTGGCLDASSTSTLNPVAHTAVANRVMVPLGPATSGGPDTAICVFNAAGSANFVLDLSGWLASTTGSPALGAQYQAIGPVRICDTRAGSNNACAGHELTPGGVLTIGVAGQGGIPSSGAVAIIGNLTAIYPSAATYLTLYPADGSPVTSDINPGAHSALPNLVVVGLSVASPMGELRLYNARGYANAALDVEGWFQ